MESMNFPAYFLKIQNNKLVLYKCPSKNKESKPWHWLTVRTWEENEKVDLEEFDRLTRNPDVLL